eukprot:snap_masked-scaffold_14-processed-gene-5.21-mRNA-1 protein AED:1.00 eAED:1.00 QI:0/0/0/0/1/1/2/0/332
MSFAITERAYKVNTVNQRILDFLNEGGLVHGRFRSTPLYSPKFGLYHSYSRTISVSCRSVVFDFSFGGYKPEALLKLKEDIQNHPFQSITLGEIKDAKRDLKVLESIFSVPDEIQHFCLANHNEYNNKTFLKSLYKQVLKMNNLQVVDIDVVKYPQFKKFLKQAVLRNHTLKDYPFVYGFNSQYLLNYTRRISLRGIRTIRMEIWDENESFWVSAFNSLMTTLEIAHLELEIKIDNLFTAAISKYLLRLFQYEKGKRVFKLQTPSLSRNEKAYCRYLVDNLYSYLPDNVDEMEFRWYFSDGSPALNSRQTLRQKLEKRTRLTGESILHYFSV